MRTSPQYFLSKKHRNNEMKKRNFSKIKSILPTKIFIFIGISAFFAFTSCSDSNDLEYEVITFQQEVDSILLNVIAPKKDSLHAQIAKSKELSQESIDLAYQAIPINTAQFLISSQSDTLTEGLKLYKSKRIKAKDLMRKLDYSRAYVDSLLLINVSRY